MSVFIYINESDDARTKLKKIEQAVADYGKELYVECHRSGSCSAGAKKYITRYLCQNFAYSALIPALFVIPSEQEIEIHVKPNHIRQIVAHAEKKSQNECEIPNML